MFWDKQTKEEINSTEVLEEKPLKTGRRRIQARTIFLSLPPTLLEKIDYESSKRGVARTDLLRGILYEQFRGEKDE